MKEVRKYFDPKSGKSYNVNPQTGIACGIDGEYPDKDTEARLVAAVRSRIKAQRGRADRDQAMRDLGLVKVRGAVSGKTYWE